ncbi:hypothetical protein PISL3812_08857 [Talaromyces islandicus]|uniref:Uncharacterized protein n=1 Tax=Talaromyces islandicus TaxID=28573 RepID=A0A0U1M861_TALIS|nr:hypothetical protein PISL3812_08857 [Talaromyces islandicus]
MSASRDRLQSFPDEPRVFILSDISNEPDDAESLDMHKILDSYDKVVQNLNAHAHSNDPYPSAKHLKSLVKKGVETYGMSAINTDVPLSGGGQLLLKRIQTPSNRPLWILCWGGTNVLASVLLEIERTRSTSEAVKLRSKLRVYTISDQDDKVYGSVTSFPIFSTYALSMVGVRGPDPTKISKDWIRANIQIGLFGSAYPEFMFIPEGDTPSFLYLIQNGLGIPESPEYGSWGGRYIRTDASGSGLANGHYSDTADQVIGLDGRRHKSNQATIWRWRDAFQNDLAARMQWTLSTDLGSCNHHPIISINGDQGLKPLAIESEAGSSLQFDASATYDPDPGDSIAFKLYQYMDPSATQWSTQHEVGRLEIHALNSAKSIVKVILPPPENCCVELISRKAVSGVNSFIFSSR